MAAAPGFRNFLLSILIIGVGLSSELLSATARVRPDPNRSRADSHLAYVVFCGQIVAVDTDQLKVVRRLGFVYRRDLMWMAESASIQRSPRVLIVAGRRQSNGHGEPGLLSISLPDLKPISSARITRESEELLPRSEVGGRERTIGAGVLVNASRNRFEFLDSRTRRPLASTTLALPSADNVYECVFSWTVTPDERKLLVLTGGGFKEQAFLRVYSLPSLAHLGDVSLLKILDDSAVALLLDEP